MVATAEFALKEGQQALLVRDDSNEWVVAEILEQLQHTFTNFTEAEKSLWDQLKIK